MNPKNSTRIDFKIKKAAPLENCCGPENMIFPNLCLAALLRFASENLYAKYSRS